MIYQTLPWAWRPWLCGKGANGTYNDTHIQFEMCEDALTNESYWKEVRTKAVHLCAWLCQEYGIEVRNVVGHYEAASAGYASNHADPQNWMKKFGDSMDKFRSDIEMMMYGRVVPVEQHSEQHYVGTVKTKTSGFINVREAPSATATIIGKLSDGETAEVIGNNVSGTFAPIKYSKTPAYIDTAYLINRMVIEESEEEDVEKEVSFYTLTIEGYGDSELTSEQASNLMDDLISVGLRVRLNRASKGADV